MPPSGGLPAARMHSILYPLVCLSPFLLSQVSQYVSMNLLRHYFAVDTTYVLKKLQVSLHPPSPLPFAAGSASQGLKVQPLLPTDLIEIITFPVWHRNRDREMINLPTSKQILMFPFMHKNWHREKDVGDGGHPYSPPRDCVNAPDLYIPVSDPHLPPPAKRHDLSRLLWPHLQMPLTVTMTAIPPPH